MVWTCFIVDFAADDAAVPPSASPLSARRMLPLVAVVAIHAAFTGVPVSQVAAVMCLGDSYMTGYNAVHDSSGWLSVDIARFLRGRSSLDKVHVEDRSFSFGCGDGQLGTTRLDTLATLLRSAGAPPLKGTSSGVVRVGACALHQMAWNRAQCGFNAALSGSMLSKKPAWHGLFDDPSSGRTRGARPNWQVAKRGVASMVDQAHALVFAMNQSDPGLLTRRGAWKVLTIQAGITDVHLLSRNATIFEKRLRTLLSFMRSHTRDVYVNLMAMPQTLESAERRMESDGYCRPRMRLYQMLHRPNDMLSSWGKGHKTTIGGADAAGTALNAAIRRAARSFDDGRTFIVRYQPVMSEFNMVASGFAVDKFSCFHPKGTVLEAVARGLMQNMLTQRADDKLSSVNRVLDANGVARPMSELVPRWGRAGAGAQLWLV